MTKSSVKNTVNFAKAKRQIAKAEVKSLSHAAALLRKTTLGSLRKGRKDKADRRVPSKQGKAPKVWDNRSGRFMKRNILFSQPERGADGKTSAQVYARPENSGDRVFQMHEFGGVQTVTITQSEKPNKNIRNYQPKPLSQRSEKERRAIKAYYKNKGKTKKIRVTARYIARPFLAPALEKIKQRLPKQWAAEMQRQLH